MLRRWGQQYHVSAANPFKLLANVGADVPGAAQFIVAMKIGESYEVAQVTAADWRRLAKACAIEEERMMELLTAMVAAMPDHVTDARDQALRCGLSAAVVAPLAELLIGHVCERMSGMGLS